MSLSPRRRLLVLERDDYTCRYCGCQLARPSDRVDLPPLTARGEHCGCGRGVLDVALGYQLCPGECVHCEPGWGYPDGLAPPEVDHIVARANGGSDDPLNLCASCGPCNRDKAAK